MIVDELVSIIRFDMPGSSKAMLGKVDGIVSSITDKVKSLGIVSAVTSGLFAAFSVNAANEAMDLAKLSHSTGIATDEIEAMGAVYRAVGGDAKNFWADAEAMKRTTGRSLNIESMIKHAEVFAGMSKDVAYQMGLAQGFSKDMIRVLMMGPDQLRSMATEAVKYNSTSKDSLDNLTDLHKAWAGFRSTMTPIANEVQAAFAPLLGDGLKTLGDFLKENKESIKEAMTAISGAFSGALDFVKNKDIKSTFDGIKSSLSGFYAEIEKVVNSGTIKSIVSSMLEIANSPLVTGTVASAFTALTAAIKPAFDILDGLFKVLSGIVNLDIEGAIIGFQKIGYAISDALEKVFLDILPKIIEQIIDAITKAKDKAFNSVSLGLLGKDDSPKKPKPKPLDIESLSPEEKHRLANASPDRDVRNKLQNLGWGEKKTEDTEGFLNSISRSFFKGTGIISESNNSPVIKKRVNNNNSVNESNSATNNTTNNIYVYPNGNDSSMDSLSRVTGLRN